MQQTRATLLGARSARIAYAVAKPDVPPKAVAVIVHGLHEHMRRYTHVVGALIGRGYVVYTLDHRGHGESQGARANVERFEYFVQDLRQLVLQAQRDYPTLPCFMIGHSMGGLIATHYAAEYQSDLAGLVLSGAGLSGGNDVSPVLKKMAAVIARVAPGLAVTPLVVGAESALSRDPLIQELYDKDPLCYTGKIKARMGHELLKAIAEAWRRVPSLALPLLIMHGTVDRIVNSQSSQQIYDQVQSADKTLKFWPDCRHEIFNEIDKNEIIAYMLDWLDAHIVREPEAAVGHSTPV